MARFKVWLPCNGATENDAKPWQSIDAERAAEEYARGRWSLDDYPTFTEVHVRAENGTLTKWTVEARQEVSFYAVVTK